MKNTSTIRRISPITIIGGFILYKIIKDADNTSIVDGILLGGLILIYVWIFFANIHYDRKKYRLTFSKISFLPSIIGTILFLSFIITQLLLDSRDSSKILLQANKDGGFNGCGFEFREDGSYKFFNGSGLGEDCFRGRYAIKDSIIMLDKSEIDNVIETNRLLIRDSERIIYQIDSNNRIILKATNFNINEDNRSTYQNLTAQ
jgi:hypothetical protein